MNNNSYAVIKYEWFQDKDLNYSMIIILGLLNSLCRKNNYCWATNKYIGEVVNLNDANTSKYINKLKELGYIEIEQNKKIRLKNEDGEYVYRQQRIITLTEKGLVKLDKDENQGFLKSSTDEVPENKNQINNNIINNLSNNNISKDISIISATGAPDGKEENIITNDNSLEEDVNLFAQDFKEPVAVEEKPKKRKQGVNLAPYIDAIDNYYKDYKQIKDAITNYIIQVNRQRAVWTLEEWTEVLDYLYDSTSISIPGTRGRKVMVNQVLEKIEFALKGNGTTPYMDFKNTPPNGNQQTFVPSFIKKGY